MLNVAIATSILAVSTFSTFYGLNTLQHRSAKIRNLVSLSPPILFLGSLFSKSSNLLGLKYYSFAFGVHIGAFLWRNFRNTNHLNDIEDNQFLISEDSEFIPEGLFKDYFFKKYICSITRQPIFDPVIDPTNEISVYE